MSLCCSPSCFRVQRLLLIRLMAYSSFTCCVIVWCACLKLCTGHVSAMIPTEQGRKWVGSGQGRVTAVFLYSGRLFVS